MSDVTHGGAGREAAGAGSSGGAAGGAAGLNALRLHRALTPLWRTPPGRWGWLMAVNHSDIGRRFILAAFFFFAVGGVLAMMIRAQLATPHSAFVGPEIYNQLFTMHGTLMMFLFAIPMFEGLAMYMLPKLLGSRDLAYPRLSAYGFWCYMGGASMLLVSMLLGVAPDGGWFMYVPLTSRAYSPGINADFWLIGITFVEVSAMAAAVEFTVSILKLRAPGMSLTKMPLFAWAILVTAGMMLFAFPPLILGSILLELERLFGWPFFETARGGDALLWQHLFWLFGHPEVYIIFLPAAGVVSTVLPVMARTRILGYGWIVAALLATGFLSFGLWVHHMFTTGIPHMALAFFSAASTLVAVPTGVQIFAWLGTLWAGRPQMKLPMLYLFGFFFTFVAGGLTGVMVAVVPFDWQAHDSYFVVAHLHYVLVGGFVFPMLAGAYYWLPHFTGRMTDYRLGKTAFWLIFIGFNMTFFLMHLTGLLGMPRRVETYPEGLGWTTLNLLSSVGGFVTAFGFALFAVDVVLHAVFGERARRNDWRAGTLEWAMLTPPPPYNIASQPHVDDRDPLSTDPDLTVKLARGDGYLGFVRNGWRETMAVDMTSGRIDHIALLPGPSRLPIVTAAFTGIFFLGILISQYWMLPIGLAGVIAMAWRWASANRMDRDHGEIDAGRGARAVVHHESTESVGWWGAVFFLTADATFFASLIFGFAFLWTIAPNWPPPALVATSWPLLLLGIAGFALAAGAGRGAGAALATAARMPLVAGGQAAGALAILLIAVTAAPAPGSHAYAATAAVLAGYAVVHALLAMLVAAFAWTAARTGHVSERRTVALRTARLFSDYGAGAGAVVLLLLQVPGMLA